MDSRKDGEKGPLMTSEDTDGNKPAAGDGTGQPGGSPERRGTPQSGRGLGGWFSALALVLSLVALAGVGASAWAWYQLRGEQSRIAGLEGRDAALAGRVAGLEQAAASASDLRQLQEQVATLARAQQSRAAASAARIDALAARLGSGVLSYREDEAAMLMRLAQSRLTVDGDVRASLQALQLADQVLAATNAANLAPVRTALAREIQALKAVPSPDVEGAVARLGAVAQAVNNLPLAGGRFEAPPPSATSVAAAGWSWKGLGQALKRAFSPLIVVRRGPAARPLLPPHEAYFVRENVKLALTSARAALLERDAASYHASLDEARRWLGAWFDTAAPEVRAARATLDQLARLDLNPALPTLGAALARLQAARAGAQGS